MFKGKIKNFDRTRSFLEIINSGNDKYMTEIRNSVNVYKSRHKKTLVNYKRSQKKISK
jgi:hypothetical protein